MKTETIFTFMAFHFTAILDKNNIEDIEETKKLIRNKKILSYLEDKYELSFDMSLFNEEIREKIEETFLSMYEGMNEKRKLGVENNGLCLLLGYCLEAIQHPPF